MKYIKLLVVIALLGVFASCEKEFAPVTGNTAVEFVNAETTVDLLGSYHYIPVQMVEQSATAAVAIVEFTGGMVEFKDGTKREVLEFTNDEEGYQNGGDIIITSKQINVGAYDAEVDGEGLPTNSFEILIPDYKNMKNIELNFELVGQNVGGNSTTKYIAKVVEDVLIGEWTMGDMAFTISKLTGTSYAMTIASAYDQDIVFNVTRNGDVLSIPVNGSQLDMSAYGLGMCDTYMCVMNDDGSFDPSAATTFTINNDAETLTADTNFILVLEAGGSWYLATESSGVAAGTVGTK